MHRSGHTTKWLRCLITVVPCLKVAHMGPALTKVALQAYTPETVLLNGAFKRTSSCFFP